MKKFLERIKAWRNLKISGLVSLILYTFNFLRDYFMGKVLDKFLESDSSFFTNSLTWILNNFLLFSVGVFFILFIGLMIVDWMKYGISIGEDKIKLIPRYGKIHQELWENESSWLEIMGTSKTDNLTAILKKINSNVNGRKSEHIEELLNSISPRLKIVDEKIFVVWNNTGESVIALNNGKSKPLPTEIDKLEIEIELNRGGKRIESFNGYLIRDWSKWKLKEPNSIK